MDRSDEGAGVVGRSGRLGRWEEIERLSALGDVVRTKWGMDKVFTHWVDGLGTRIDWVLSADYWGVDVWQEIGVVWCPWSDHWGVLGQGKFGGSGEGPGHWQLNCALLSDGDLWEKWEGEVVTSMARWKEEGAPVGLRWVKLKEVARMYWSEAGKQRGRLQRMKGKWASCRMEQLLWE